VGKSGILTEKQNIFDLLRDFIDRGIRNGIISKNGDLQPRIFIRDGVAYRFTVKLGEATFSYEIGDEI